MPKTSSINIKELGKKVQNAALDIADKTPSATPPAPEEAVQQSGGTPGRKKRTSISRKNVKTMYFEDKMWIELENVGYNNRVNTQRVVQAAIYDFFKKHYKDERLDAEGMAIIEEYEQAIQI